MQKAHIFVLFAHNGLTRRCISRSYIQSSSRGAGGITVNHLLRSALSRSVGTGAYAKFDIYFRVCNPRAIRGERATLDRRQRLASRLLSRHLESAIIDTPRTAEPSRQPIFLTQMTTDAELETQRMSLALEAQKWEYKKKELIFVEAGQHIRALNVTLWQVPSMAIAITGGLWYGISLFDQEAVKIAALIFTSIVDLVTVRIIWRLRAVMSGYLTAQLSFQSLTDEGKPKHVVMWCWTIILCGAAILGVLGAANVKSLAREVPNVKPATTSCENSIALNFPRDAVRSDSDAREPTKTLHQQKCQ